MQNKCPLSAPKNEKVAIKNYLKFEWDAPSEEGKQFLIIGEEGKKLLLAGNKRIIQLFIILMLLNNYYSLNTFKLFLPTRASTLFLKLEQYQR